MVKVKICGMTNLKDALKAAELGADLVGFIFFEKSPRKIDAEKARPIIEDLPEGLSRVGLFMDQDLDFVKEIASRCHLDMLQLHGKESPDYCARLAKDEGSKNTKNSPTPQIIKTFRVSNSIDPDEINKYKTADFFLFDTYVKNTPGGTGKSFDWSILEGANFSKPIFLAGGLKTGNVKEAIERVRPYAVDVASGVEKSPGVKDYKLMKEFIRNAKGTR